MSSVGARKVIRTYSRQRKPSLYDEEPSPKRRRVEQTQDTSDNETVNNATTTMPSRSSSPPQDGSALPSSSPKEASDTFSDALPQSTPPSSPAPQTQNSPSPPRARRRKLVFSTMKRKQNPETSAMDVLSERSHNVPNPAKQPPKKKRLVQMQLDLVAEVSKMCKVCGMGYVPSHAEDAALHRKFHALNVGGVDISKAMVGRLRKNQVWSGGDRSFIAVVSRKDPLAFRNKASEVLKVVNTELGAVPISDEVLWSRTRNSIPALAPPVQEHEGLKKAPPPPPAKREADDHSTSDRFKAYLFVQGQKCVGACLAERIQSAFRVLGQNDDAAGRQQHTGQHPADSGVGSSTDSSSISIDSGTTTPAILGISRIWSSSLHRKCGLATRLLDAARADFLYGMTVDKQAVAFSQPTESGGHLARKWFGQRAGWLVYMD